MAAILVIIGALCFGMKAIFVKLAYQYTVHPITLMTLRMGFSLPIFLVVAWREARKQKRSAEKHDIRFSGWLSIASIGICGFYFATWFDLEGLLYIPAGIERLILYVYPTIVLWIMAVLYRQKILKIQLAAILITYVGLFLTFWDKIQTQGNTSFFLGASFVFAAAVAYAIYMVGSSRWIKVIGPLRYNALSMTAASFAIIVHYIFLGDGKLFVQPVQVYYLALAIALISTVLPSFLIAEGIRVIGPGNVSIISGIGPILTILLAYFILEETFGGLQWMGALVTISGVLLITLKKSARY